MDGGVTTGYSSRSVDKVNVRTGRGGAQMATPPPGGWFHQGFHRSTQARPPDVPAGPHSVCVCVCDSN